MNGKKMNVVSEKLGGAKPHAMELEEKEAVRGHFQGILEVGMGGFVAFFLPPPPKDNAQARTLNPPR